MFRDYGGGITGGLPAMRARAELAGQPLPTVGPSIGPSIGPTFPTPSIGLNMGKQAPSKFVAGMKKQVPGMLNKFSEMMARKYPTTPAQPQLTNPQPYGSMFQRAISRAMPRPNPAIANPSPMNPTVNRWGTFGGAF